MNSFRLSAVLLAGALVTASCSRQDEAVVASVNPLLAYVPAETPYVFANLAPIEAATLDAWEARLQPLLDHAQSQLQEIRQDLDSGHAGMDAAHSDIMRAVIDELDGKMSLDGLASLGIDSQALSTIYGNGMFPVARLGLLDAQALRDTIARIEANSGRSIPEFEHNGVAYWKIANPKEAMAAYIAILDDHVVMSAAPLAVEAEVLPVLLGREMPAESVADTGALESLNRDRGFLPHGSGYLDMARIMEEMLDPGSRTAIYLAAIGEYDAGSIDPTCVAEARLIAAVVPRMAMGVTELSADTMSVQYHLDLEPALAKEMTRLVADVPRASDSSDYLFSAALGIKVGGLREWMLQKTNAMTAAPFRCPKMQDVNRKIMQMAAQLNQPMPPFIGNLKGFRAVLKDFDPANPDPATSQGMLSLEVESPQMLIGMAGMFVPGFEQLDIQPGGDPVRIPEELMSVVTPEFEVYAVMTRDAIGMSLGKGLSDQLVGFMEQDADNDGVFLSLDYDMGALAAMQQRGQDWAAGVTEENVGMHGHQQLAEAYRAMLGRSRTEFGFAESGVVISSRMTFK